MMKKIALVATTGLLVMAMAGCGKKAEETTVEAAPVVEETAPAESAPANAPTAQAAPGNEVLPGASSVRAALGRKDYETAVGALLALRGAATQPPQSNEYVALYDEVKFALMDASLTDRKAAEALISLRAATAGR